MIFSSITQPSCWWMSWSERAQENWKLGPHSFTNVLNEAYLDRGTRLPFKEKWRLDSWTATTASQLCWTQVKLAPLLLLLGGWETSVFLKPCLLHEQLCSFSKLLTIPGKSLWAETTPMCQQKATFICLALFYSRTNSGFRTFCCCISFLIAGHTYTRPHLSVWSVYSLSWRPNCLLVTS